MILPEQVVQNHYFLQNLDAPLALNLVRVGIALLCLLTLYLCHRLAKRNFREHRDSDASGTPRNGG